MYGSEDVRMYGSDDVRMADGVGVYIGPGG
jgi:hypothetical protein